MSYLFRNKKFHTTPKRFYDKFRKMLLDKLDASTEKRVLKAEHLENRPEYKFPNKVIDPEQKKIANPKTLEEQNKMVADRMREWTELEKRRMKAVDELLGTDTYFHDIQEQYEERLDSEFVMVREKLKRKYELASPGLKGIDLDPQVKIRVPEIRNLANFRRQIQTDRKQIFPINFLLLFKTSLLYINSFSLFQNLLTQLT